MKQIHGAKHFDFIPHAYILPKDREAFKVDFMRVIIHFFLTIKIINNCQGKRKLKPGELATDLSNCWIFKPNNLSRGRGVHLVTELEQIIEEEDTAVIQKYKTVIGFL